MISPTEPFVLIDDARAGGGPARLYREPRETIVAATPDAVPAALAKVRDMVASGRHIAGFLGYAAGFGLEPRLAGQATSPEDAAPPPLWFGVFDRCEGIAAADVPALLPDPRGAVAHPPRPRIDRERYDAMFKRVAGYIAAGDIYQANLSFRADVRFAGHPLALYAGLRIKAAAGWGGIASTGQHWLLSLSPELFFTLHDRGVVARPMKGTAPRGSTPETDAAAAAALATDPKERAENLMIVDLLRNDLSRVAEAGSVAVPALFSVETYPTLHTLTSTITAQLAAGRDAIDLLAATFPCGSVTGAPKIRAMEVIAEVEADARGPYTGSLGWIAPGGDAAFNVMIRTLVIGDTAARRGHGAATLGLGSAVVADSRADAEWAECLAKARFVHPRDDGAVLIETMRFDPVDGIASRAQHLERLATSAMLLGYAYGPRVADALDAAIDPLDAPARVRLTLARNGTVDVTVGALPDPPAGSVDVVVRELSVDPADIRLRHKTSDRAFYDDARAASGAFEVVFVDRDDRVTEGSFTNVFVERDGVLLTPPLARGLLPGILRRALIDDNRAREAELTPDDLADGFLIGNALRGLLPARLREG